MDYPFLHFQEKIVICTEIEPIRIVDIFLLSMVV